MTQIIHPSIRRHTLQNIVLRFRFSPINRMNQEVLNAAGQPGLKVISTMSVGYDVVYRRQNHIIYKNCATYTSIIVQSSL